VFLEYYDWNKGIERKYWINQEPHNTGDIQIMDIETARMLKSFGVVDIIQ
jgi:hypothetical protein